MKIGQSPIGEKHQTYFIADIAANHDGNLSRAVELINRCADSGANAAKFQNFFAETIVSDFGFKSLPKLESHQSKWGSSVYEMYDKASISLEWTHHLKEACTKAGIDYFTAPYDLSVIPKIDPYVVAWKIGSGDITWHKLIVELAKKDKPLLIATGASGINEIKLAISIAQKYNNKIVLMQCNTNYTASLENFKYINLKVLKTYSVEFPGIVLGLSDHTPGHSTVLGAIAYGARVIEKHFTDDNSREGPDHKFSMDPKSWQEMVKRSRELENALGNGSKKVEDNEAETVILQRRALRTNEDLEKGTILTESNIIGLRPCPANGLAPYEIEKLLGKPINRKIHKGDIITENDIVLKG